MILRLKLNLLPYLCVSVSHYEFAFGNVVVEEKAMAVEDLDVLCSHIYTYMTFGLFTYLSFPIGRTDRNRVFGLPVLPNFHPEGPVSQH